MKKILLSIALIIFTFSGYSQTVLNETYSNPGTGNSEFIELYNSSTFGAQQMDCFTILTLWTTSATVRGWYVLDLPAGVTASKSWYVLAADNPFNFQGGAAPLPDVNWNDATFRSGATGGYLKKYQVNAGGTGYNEINITGVNQNDVLAPADDMAGGQNRLTLLFQNGIYINGFWGGGNSATLPAFVTGLPDLPVMPAGICGAPFTIHFAKTPAPPPANTTNVGAVEHVNQSAGSDNGYRRLTDGKCGSWDKASSQINHTPGTANGAAGTTGAGLTTAQFANCNVPRAVFFDITAIVNNSGVTEADDFPVEIQVYNDINGNGQLNGTDVFVGSKLQSNVAAAQDSVQLTGTNKNATNIIVVYKTQRGCFDKVVAIATGCAPLPVSFKSFTATRSKSNVMVKWETSTEINNSGFAVERNINGSWEQVAFVPSQANGGNSVSDLSYQYIDLNNAKGISQYRIRQVDFDDKSKYTEIRSVKGESQIGKIIVYPNPTADGRINVVFDDASTVRDIMVMDMSGRTVKQIRGIANNNVTIDNLMPGMYTLRVFVPATSEQSVQKIVVNNR